MSNVNDNNLDDLLRRAAEKYPLRTDSADWDRLAADLDGDPSLVLATVNTEDRRRRRRFFWLFFLLPLAGVGYYTWHGNKPGSGGVEIGQKEHAVVAKEKENKVKEKENIGTSSGTGTTADGNRSKAVADAGTSSTDGERNTGTRKPSTSGDAGGNKAAAEEKGPADGNTATTQTGGNVPDQKNINKAPDQKIINNNVVGAPSRTANNNVVGAPSRTAGGKVSLASVKDAFAVNIPVKAKTTAQTKESPAQKDKVHLQKPKHSFYVGILGSPDLSAVKFQSVKNVGVNFGVLLGYSFNSRWSIETGAYFDHKKYYTEGEYFSKKNVQALYDVDIQNVNGVCNMWEIPVNVRYNFPSGGKMKWFATAGLSTYLMTKESYNYEATKWGTPWGVGKTYTYETPYHNLFSILNLSVGYEQRLGKIGNLRLEPYLRVPLSGIGTGNLSIMSAGLNIGITRRIW